MESEQSTRLQQLVDRGALENLASALRLYMLADACTCWAGGIEPCSDGCERCLYCVGRTALTAIGAEDD